MDESLYIIRYSLRVAVATVICWAAAACHTEEGPKPIDELAARVTCGTSVGQIDFVELPADEDFFEIRAGNGRVVIEGNRPVSMAVGLNWYLKYVAGIHISWNRLRQPLPSPLPLPAEPIRRSTPLRERYYLNYCTYSYSMPFWDRERWEEEIDWMALHGVTMPLALTGTEAVWRNVLRRLGYTDEEVGEFVAGPAYQAWWLMNNIEGWGGPLPAGWYDAQEALQKHNLERMRALGMEPVLPGYAGMVPRNIGEKLGYRIADPGRWCGFPRPAFLSPEDEHFDEIADLYYEESARLYGPARYYSMDPFHEGGNTQGVDLYRAAQSMLGAMRRANPEARWVIQSWQDNPRRELLDTLRAGDLVVLDLYSEKIPKWRSGYRGHDWMYCMLLNFGGNVGLHGRMDALIDGFYEALAADPSLCGVGATPEGIENNPVMFELLYELPWRAERFDSRTWLREYLCARYGRPLDPEVEAAWEALRHTVYNAPVGYRGEGTVESILCARPSWSPRSASTWGSSRLFYAPDSTARAAALLRSVAGRYADCPNFQYDMVDICRQANADRAGSMLEAVIRARAEADNAHRHLRVATDWFHAGDPDDYCRIDRPDNNLVCALDRAYCAACARQRRLADDFLALILRQDSLLRTCPDFSVDRWLAAATARAATPSERRLYRCNAAQLVTVWGDDRAANQCGLHDYSHREWAGLLRDLYYPRWKAFFDAELDGAPAPDFYGMECAWVDEVSQ